MKYKVAIVMGSDSDLPSLKGASECLSLFGIDFEIRVLSAHRTPLEVSEFAKSARANGFQIIIAGAGGSAHLPGMVASFSDLPVIGVPVASAALLGKDALLSILQMPEGVPVATVGIGSSFNAGLLAVQILAAQDPSLSEKLRDYKEKLRQEVLAKKLEIKPS